MLFRVGQNKTQYTLYLYNFGEEKSEKEKKGLAYGSFCLFLPHPSLLFSYLSCYHSHFTLFITTPLCNTCNDAAPFQYLCTFYITFSLCITLALIGRVGTALCLAVPALMFVVLLTRLKLLVWLAWCLILILFNTHFFISHLVSVCVSVRVLSELLYFIWGFHCPVVMWCF